jgi:hypothetical protein
VVELAAAFASTAHLLTVLRAIEHILKRFCPPEQAKGKSGDSPAITRLNNEFRTRLMHMGLCKNPKTESRNGDLPLIAGAFPAKG